MKTYYLILLLFASTFCSCNDSEKDARIAQLEKENREFKEHFRQIILESMSKKFVYVRIEYSILVDKSLPGYYDEYGIRRDTHYLVEDTAIILSSVYTIEGWNEDKKYQLMDEVQEHLLEQIKVRLQKLGSIINREVYAFDSYAQASSALANHKVNRNYREQY